MFTVTTRISIAQVLAHRCQDTQKHERQQANMDLDRTRTLLDRTISIEHTSVKLSMTNRITMTRIITRCGCGIKLLQLRALSEHLHDRRHERCKRNNTHWRGVLIRHRVYYFEMVSLFSVCGVATGGPGTGVV